MKFDALAGFPGDRPVIGSFLDPLASVRFRPAVAIPLRTISTDLHAISRTSPEPPSGPVRDPWRGPSHTGVARAPAPHPEAAPCLDAGVKDYRRRMRIGELAEQAGTTTRTLRYYESRGLLPARRTDNGYRTYDGDDLRLLRQIRMLQDFGFELEETRPFVDCLRAGHPAGDSPPATAGRCPQSRVPGGVPAQARRTRRADRPAGRRTGAGRTAAHRRRGGRRRGGIAAL